MNFWYNPWCNEAKACRQWDTDDINSFRQSCNTHMIVAQYLLDKYEDIKRCNILLLHVENGPFISTVQGKHFFSIIIMYYSRWGSISRMDGSFCCTNLLFLHGWKVPAQRHNNYIQVQEFDSTKSGRILPGLSTGNPYPLCVSGKPCGPDALEKIPWPTCNWGPWLESWGTSRNLKVIKHVVYYNNWNGSHWKQSLEYCRDNGTC